MFWRKCCVQTFIEFAVHVFRADDTDGMQEQMCDGDKLGVVFPEILICSGLIYRIFMATELNVHRLRIDKQILINSFHGLASTFL